jgi:hypothetical protein
VATAINDLGVPAVLIQDELFSGTLSTATVPSVSLDVSRYASAVLMVSSPGILLIEHLDDSGNVCDVYSLSVGFTGSWKGRIALSGERLQITTSAFAGQQVTVLASNRAALHRIDGRRNDVNGGSYSVLCTGNGTFNFPIPDTEHFQGLCFLNLEGSVTIGAGVVGLLCVTSAGTLRLIAQRESVADAGGSKSANKLAALPVGGYTLQANVTAFAANFTATLTIVQAI